MFVICLGVAPNYLFHKFQELDAIEWIYYKYFFYLFIIYLYVVSCDIFVQHVALSYAFINFLLNVRNAYNSVGLFQALLCSLNHGLLYVLIIFNFFLAWIYLRYGSHIHFHPCHVLFYWFEIIVMSMMDVCTCCCIVPFMLDVK